MPPQAGSRAGSANGNILNFFKPAAPRPQTQPSSSPLLPQDATQTVSQQIASSSLTPPPPSSPPISASTPSSHHKLPTRPATREIEASDDEGSDGHSDDSLEDLSLLLGRGPSSQAHPGVNRPHQNNPFSTPKAKRTAVGFHASPLAIISKHKFDLKALANDARLDDATNASSMRVRAATDVAKSEKFASKAKPAAAGEALEGIVKDKSGRDAQKVMRAVQRSEAGSSELRYYFFERTYTAPLPSPAPKKASTGPWRLLTQGSARVKEQHLTSGLPQTIVRKNGGLPDELLEWILDELCIQKSLIVCQEYCNIVAECPTQVGRLLTPQRLEDLFLRLGASEELKTRDYKLNLLQQDEEYYKGRDWLCVRSFIMLLGCISRHLSVPSVIYAAQTLLRLSLDKLVLGSMDILQEYEDAMQKLVNAIPRPSWEDFCHETCSMIQANTDARCIKATALLCLPVSDPAVHDLRRRLAVTSLFGDAKLGRHRPEDLVTLRAIIDCLDDDAFAINAKTDFAELNASVIILDIVIDDGSASPSADPEEEKKFNAEVDELAAKLREIWRKINDAGMKLVRTEAKSVVEWVQQRLSHSVRTRRKAKKSIFDLPGQMEDPFLPRQQDYMKKFLVKKTKSPPVDDEDDDAIVVAGG